MRVNIVFFKALLLIIFVLGGCKREIKEDVCSFKDISVGESIYSLKKKFEVRYESSIEAYVVYIPSDSLFRSDVVVRYEKKSFFKRKVVKKAFWRFNSCVTFEEAFQFCKNEFGDYIQVSGEMYKFRKEKCYFILTNFRTQEDPGAPIGLSLTRYDVIEDNK